MRKARLWSWNSPNFKSIVRDYFSTKKLILTCLNNPSDWGIETSEDLEEILLVSTL